MFSQSLLRLAVVLLALVVVLAGCGNKKKGGGSYMGPSPVAQAMTSQVSPTR